MLTLLRWTPPEVPDHFPADIRQYLREQNRSIAEYLRSLDGEDALAIAEFEEWTPSDVSGASLSFTTPVGHYMNIGGLITAWGRVTYPVTASGANAKIGGLPFTVRNLDDVRGGFVNYCTDAAITSVIPTNNTTELQIIAGAAVATNAQMSGDLIYFTCVYPAA